MKKLWFLSLLALGLPLAASAHEVYVLDQSTIDTALSAPRFSDLGVAMSNLPAFLQWGLIVASVIVLVFIISITRTVENLIDPILAKLPPYAPIIGRVTIGLAFIAGAYYGALFGPELPLNELFGPWTTAITALLIIGGFMILVGFYARLAALAMLVLFAIAIFKHGIYMFTYTNYAGELLLLLILGAHKLAFHRREHDEQNWPWLVNIKDKLQPFAFPALRIAFGVSLIYASLYAKIIHNELALSVATNYPDVVAFFGFEPHFLVLGASIIEVLIGAFFILGVEIRFTSLFLLFWLSLSLWYFGEVVWPHLILIGIPIAFICYGYDKYSLEGWLFKREGREPVL